MPFNQLQNYLSAVNTFTVECTDRKVSSSNKPDFVTFIGAGNVSVICQNVTTDNLTIDWQESGSWNKPHKISFTNAYRWQLDAVNKTVSVSHARFGWDKLVHLVDLSFNTNNNCWDTITPHLCGSDNYQLSIASVDSDCLVLKLQWRIVGDKKDLNIVNCYTLDH